MVFRQKFSFSPKMLYLCQARVDNLMFNNKRQVSIPLHPKGWSFLETDYMKSKNFVGVAGFERCDLQIMSLSI